MPKEPQHNQVHKHYWFAAHKAVAIAFVAPFHRSIRTNLILIFSEYILTQ